MFVNQRRCGFVKSVLTLTFLSVLLQLAYCIVQFLEKDPTLTEPVSLHCCRVSAEQ